MARPGEAPRREVGVAVAIPQPWGSQLDEYRQRVGDPMAPFIPAHLTLFVGSIADEPGIDAKIIAHLAAVAAAHLPFQLHPPFQLHLRGTGTFRPVTPVVFVAVAGGWAECARLAADIRSGPLGVKLTYPYHPHVTVAHAVAEAKLDQVQRELAGFQARFPVDGFSLYYHCADGHWRPQRRLLLAQ